MQRSSVTEDQAVRQTESPLPTKGEVPEKDALQNESNRQHLTTDHLLANLKGRTVSSGFVTTASQSVQFVLNLVSIMILARMLMPKDFGLVAMVTVIMGFLRIFKDAGL